MKAHLFIFCFVGAALGGPGWDNNQNRGARRFRGKIYNKIKY